MYGKMEGKKGEKVLLENVPIHVKLNIRECIWKMCTVHVKCNGMHLENVYLPCKMECSGDVLRTA